MRDVVAAVLETRRTTMRLVAGLEEGTWSFWDVRTSWRATGEFVGGHRDGVWLEYEASPDPVRERVYRDGQLVTVREL